MSAGKKKICRAFGAKKKSGRPKLLHAPPKKINGSPLRDRPLDILGGGLEEISKKKFASNISQKKKFASDFKKNKKFASGFKKNKKFASSFSYYNVY